MIHRIVSIALYTILSICFMFWLPEKFCELWRELAADTQGTSGEIACKWQIFGFRIVFMIIYFPLDAIITLVVIRQCQDFLLHLMIKDKMSSNGFSSLNEPSANALAELELMGAQLSHIQGQGSNASASKYGYSETKALNASDLDNS